MKRILRWASALMLLSPASIALADCNQAASPFGGGMGTLEDPYLICSAQQLNNIGDLYLSSSFRLDADLDMTGVTFNQIASNSYYSGMFDGNNKVISNLQISADSLALGMINSIVGGEVRDLYLRNCSVVNSRAGSPVTGCLAGYAENATITNVFLTGTVSSRGYIGGLIGYGDEVTITHTSSVINVEPRIGGKAGGIAGELLNSSIARSGADITLFTEGSFEIGGLVGSSNGTGIAQSYAIGTIDQRSTNSIIGGLVGTYYPNGRDLSLFASFSLVRIDPFWPVYTGGLIGFGPAGGMGSLLVDKCFTASSIRTGLRGGFCATNCTSNMTGGINFWDSQTTGSSTTSDSVSAARTTAELQTTSTFTGFDFSTTWTTPAPGRYPSLQQAAPLFYTPTPTPTVTRTATATATATSTHTRTPTMTATPSATSTASPTSTASQTPTFTPSTTPTVTVTATATPTVTATQTTTVTPTSSATSTATPEPTSTSTTTPTATVQPTTTLAPTVTATATPTATLAATPCFGGVLGAPALTVVSGKVTLSLPNGVVPSAFCTVTGRGVIPATKREIQRVFGLKGRRVVFSRVPRGRWRFLYSVTTLATGERSDSAGRTVTIR